jgi:hypothetical protein
VGKDVYTRTIGTRVEVGTLKAVDRDSKLAIYTIDFDGREFSGSKKDLDQQGIEFLTEESLRYRFLLDPQEIRSKWSSDPGELIGEIVRASLIPLRARKVAEDAVKCQLIDPASSKPEDELVNLLGGSRFVRVGGESENRLLLEFCPLLDYLQRKKLTGGAKIEAALVTAATTCLQTISDDALLTKVCELMEVLDKSADVNQISTRMFKIVLNSTDREATYFRVFDALLEASDASENRVSSRSGILALQLVATAERTSDIEFNTVRKTDEAAIKKIIRSNFKSGSGGNLNSSDRLYLFAALDKVGLFELLATEGDWATISWTDLAKLTAKAPIWNQLTSGLQPLLTSVITRFLKAGTGTKSIATLGQVLLAPEPLRLGVRQAQMADLLTRAAEQSEELRTAVSASSDADTIKQLESLQSSLEATFATKLSSVEAATAANESRLMATIADLNTDVAELSAKISHLNLALDAEFKKKIDAADEVEEELAARRRAAQIESARVLAEVLVAIEKLTKDPEISTIHATASRRAAEAMGVTSFASRGDIVKFSERFHMALGGIQNGQVEAVSSGYSFGSGDSEIVLVKAIVIPARADGSNHT